MERTYDSFAERFGHDVPSGPESGVAVAPGRINIIGEHTDYNDGFVLPMAIDRYVTVAFEPTSSGAIEIWSEHADASGTIDLHDLTRTGIPNWLLYASGMAWAAIESGITITGCRMAVCSSLPVGAGVSSSAAFEVALGTALTVAMGAQIEPVEIARMAHKSDHKFVGIPSGIMDQFASACCRENHALLLDCKDESFNHVQMPTDGSVVVIDTGKRRELVEGAYAERVESCRKAVRKLNEHFEDVDSLRAASLDQLFSIRTELDEVTFRRARHVITEIDRPAKVARAFHDRDLVGAGRLMNNSHRSLADDYEVSCDELDAAVDIAREHPDCYGARLTGAGFGGCAIALCRRSSVSEFVEFVEKRYRDRFGVGEAYAVKPSNGVTVVS